MSFPQVCRDVRDGVTWNVVSVIHTELTGGGLRCESSLLPSSRWQVSGVELNESHLIPFMRK